VWFGVMTLIMPHLLALTILFYLVSALVVFVSFVLYIIASSLTTAKREKPEFVIPTYRPR